MDSGCCLCHDHRVGGVTGDLVSLKSVAGSPIQSRRVNCRDSLFLGLLCFRRTLHDGLALRFRARGDVARCRNHLESFLGGGFVTGISNGVGDPCEVWPAKSATRKLNRNLPDG